MMSLQHDLWHHYIMVYDVIMLWHYDIIMTSLCYDFITVSCHYFTLSHHNVEMHLPCILMVLLYDALLHYDIITLHFDVIIKGHVAIT